MSEWGTTEKDGKVYVHVTSALSVIRQKFLETWRGNVGNAEADRIRDDAVDFGKTFHTYCEIIDKRKGHEIDVEGIEDPVMKNLIEKFRDWFIENVEEVIMVEKTFYSDKYLYCGTPDVVYKLKGRTVPAIIDRKTSNSLSQINEFQLSMYQEMLAENGIKTKDRIILHANKKTGKFKEVLLDPETHAQSFNAGFYAKELYLILNKK